MGPPIERQSSHQHLQVFSRLIRRSGNQKQPASKPRRLSPFPKVSQWFSSLPAWSIHQDLTTTSLCSPDMWHPTSALKAMCLCPSHSNPTYLSQASDGCHQISSRANDIHHSSSQPKCFNNDPSSLKAQRQDHKKDHPTLSVGSVVAGA